MEGGGQQGADHKENMCESSISRRARVWREFFDPVDVLFCLE